MYENNNIEFLFMREDLLQVFSELILQLNIKNKDKIIYNIIEDINKNNFIVILDSDSLNKLIRNKVTLNNYLFVIGEISSDMANYLSINYINYEIINEPINILSLLKKLKNLIDQKNSALLEVKEFKKFKYSSRLKIIYVDEISLYLTDKENEIFQILINNKNSPLNKKQLLSKVWNYSEDIDTHTLETHIYTLRQKIEKKLNLNNIIEHTDKGYRIDISK
jgi:DNA-binding response OmpR family regulator